jgi:hypothetical protein
VFNRPIKETENNKMVKDFWKTLIVRDGLLVTADK